MILEDADMKFDKDKKRYVLTESYVFNELADLKIVGFDEFDTNPSTLSKRILERTSKMFFNFTRSQSADYLSSIYFATQNEDVFNALKEALLYQVEYLLQVGDTANAVGMKKKDRVQNAGIDDLKGLNFFGVVFYDLTDNVNEW